MLIPAAAVLPEQNFENVAVFHTNDSDAEFRLNQASKEDMILFSRVPDAADVGLI